MEEMKGQNTVSWLAAHAENQPYRGSLSMPSLQVLKGPALTTSTWMFSIL